MRSRNSLAKKATSRILPKIFKSQKLCPWLFTAKTVKLETAVLVLGLLRAVHSCWKPTV